MAITKIVMPAMGESIFECTVLDWLVSEGDEVDIDDMILEVATDKIDTEIGSSHKGTITKFLVKKGDVVAIGSPICEIDAEGDIIEAEEEFEFAQELESQISSVVESVGEVPEIKSTDRFYSPLVLNIAREEQISQQELDSITGTGLKGRVTKKDILNYLDKKEDQTFQLDVVSTSTGEDTITEMDRMRQMISERMIDSRRTSAHVTSFIETDMTSVVEWRKKAKDRFATEHNTKLTFTPILIEAVVKAIQKYRGINIQVEGNKIIQKGNINIGMAVALPDGNLIVPVIHHADQLNLVQLTEKSRDLAIRARENRLKPHELTGGTYTISNIGTFDNLMGTPIIVQPQVAIIAFGAIVKKPAVIETEMGDLIGIRQKMFVSHSYDHRVIDGSLGGLFLKEVKDQLQNFDTTRLT